ncbi:unnamed protein product [Sphagnum jensenii]|uniref:Cysteine protease n=1 Tax=Sphagnum jensenii TaxID=128206 RepID=A0ABP1ADR6_9BRYO
MASLVQALLLFVCVLVVASRAFAAFSGEEGIAQVTDRDNRRAGTDFMIAEAALKGAEAKFRGFVREYGKVYATDEERQHRFKAFRHNLMKAVEHQALDPTAVHGVTEFSDLTEEEFAAQFLGLKVPEAIKNAPSGPDLPTGDLPEEFDWRNLGAVTPVKNQGACGSCWAFSTTGAVEGAHFLATGKLVSLSEQQLVDCDHQCDPEEKDACDAGCGGGLMTNAYNYVMEAGGLESESDYPYKGSNGKCKYDSNKIAAKVTNFTNIPIDEDQMAAYLVHQGPLAVGINAAYMQTYIAGVSCPIVCNKHNLDHGVLLVGYGKHGFAPLRLSYKPYWVIKNSWGPMWGDHGYYKICRGHGECGLNTMVSAVAAVGVATDTA